MTAVDWALTRDLSATKKLLLVGLAWIADDNGVTFKGQKTIAARLGQDPRWVREHLSSLAAAGLVSRYRRHRLNGSRTSDLLVLNMPRAEPLDLSHYSGLLGEREAGDQEPSGGNPPGGLAAEIREPSGGNPPGHTENQKSQPASSLLARPREDEIPDGFPDELRPHARRVMAVLKEAASERGADAVTVRAVGRAVMDNPRKSLVTTAQDLRAWLLDGKGRTRPCKDVVRRYRDWLRDAPDLEAVERLADDGTPATGNGKLPAGVTPIRRGEDPEITEGAARLRALRIEAARRRGEVQQ